MALEHSFPNIPQPNANYAMHAPRNGPAYYDGPMPHRPPPSMATPDMLPPSPSDDFRSPRITSRPPPMPHHHHPPSSPRWDSLPAGSYSVGNSPTSSRFSQQSNSGQPRMRSRPTTPATKHEVFSMISDTRSEPPSRPLTAKSSLGDLRGQQDYYGPGMENFSRPRKSLRQPSTEMPYRARPALLPTHSEDTTPMYHHPAPLPSPRHGPRRPSIASHSSSTTWAPGFSPTTGEFPDVRGQSRMRNPGPPPVSAAPRPPYGHSNRIDSSGSGSAYGGAVPWLGGDELRSSFRSQLTASSAPGTANTERSSVLTKDSSSTSIDVHNEGDPDEPSIEDVMGMYEDGFEDDEHAHNQTNQHHIEHDEAQQQLPQQQSPQHRHLIPDDRTRPASGEDFPSRPLTAAAPPSQASPVIMVDPVENLPEPRSVMSSNLDAEIRRSKLFFTSPAFMASLSHLSTADDEADDDKDDDDKRDSGKSLNSDPSEDATKTSLPLPNGGIAMNSDMARPTTAPANPQSAKPANPGLSNDYPESCLPPAMSGPAELEEPGSRDRYGFKKQNQHITRQQYDGWDSGYSEYLLRRKKKWVGYLKESGLMTDPPNRFPAANPKTKRFVRKGIPPEWRGAAWFYYAGGPAILAKCGGLYSKILDKRAKRSDVEAIERDLHRTFPDNIKFKPPGGQDPSDTDGSDSSQPFQSRADEPPIISSLRRVLFAFSIYNPQIGYCQSLNFIAGLLLLFVDTEEKVFWLLNVITHIYLPGTHDISLEGSKVDLGVLMAEIQETMPSVWDKIGGELEADPIARPQTGKSLMRQKSRFRRRPRVAVPTERLPPITLCMTAWFMSCFVGTLPIETTLRVWDVFFLEGSKTMFRVALSIFKLNESEIKAVSDPMEMFGVVQAMPRRMLDANALLEMCFKKRNGFGHLSQGAIEERRKQRRELAQAEKDAHLSGGPKTLTAGNVTELDSHVERKGTIFGRRRRDRSRGRAVEV